MRRFAALALAAAMLPGLAGQAGAADRYKFDPEHTRVLYFVSHFGFSQMKGQFNRFDGDLSFDQKDPAKSTLAVTIYSDSVTMDHAKLDDHLKSKDFFDAGAHPTITFKSSKVEATGPKTGKVTGDLTLLGVTKPVTLAVAFNAEAVHPVTKATIAGFSATGKLKRSDYGMTFLVPQGIGDEVDIRIETEWVKQ